MFTTCRWPDFVVGWDPHRPSLWQQCDVIGVLFLRSYFTLQLSLQEVRRMSEHDMAVNTSHEATYLTRRRWEPDMFDLYSHENGQTPWNLYIYIYIKDDTRFVLYRNKCYPSTRFDPDRCIQGLTDCLHELDQWQCKSTNPKARFMTDAMHAFDILLALPARLLLYVKGSTMLPSRLLRKIWHLNADQRFP